MTACRRYHSKTGHNLRYMYFLLLNNRSLLASICTPFEEGEYNTSLPPLVQALIQTSTSAEAVEAEDGS